MKNILIVLFVAFGLNTACNNAGTTKENNTEPTEEGAEVQGNGEISFEESVFDFGEIEEGEIVNHKFKFTNTGSEPVIISKVSASCGCTTPEYTSTPVAPGKEGEIAVRFDSNGQKGVQQKIVTIASNAKEKVITVQLKGAVK